MTSNPQTEARALARFRIDWEHDDTGYPDLVRVWSDDGPFVSYDDHATALAAKDAELAETASALWRIPPNMHTIPCEANGFAEPDPFEGVGETYADAYTREKSRAERAEAQLAEARKALVEIETQSRLVPVYSSQVTSGQILSSKISMIRDIASRAVRRALTGGQEDG